METYEKRLIYVPVCQKTAAKDSLHSPYGCHMCISQSLERTKLRRGWGRQHWLGEISFYSQLHQINKPPLHSMMKTFVMKREFPDWGTANLMSKDIFRQHALGTSTSIVSKVNIMPDVLQRALAAAACREGMAATLVRDESVCNFAGIWVTWIIHLFTSSQKTNQ